jgi:plastocyanin
MAPRARPVAIAAACWLLLLAGAARAVDDGSVNIKDHVFTDSSSGTTLTTIADGGTVTWHWTGPGLTHSVTFDPGQTVSPNDSDPGTNGTTTFPSHNTGDTFMVTFPTSGCFIYHCKVHPEMHGEVQVGMGVCPPLSGGGGGGGGGGNGPPPPPPPASPGPDTTAPAFSAVKVKAKKLTFKLTEPAKVTIKVRKGHKLVKTFHFSGKKGSNSFRLTHRGLKTGVTYKAQVTAVDKAGNKSRLASVSVKL